MVKKHLGDKLFKDITFAAAAGLVNYYILL